MLWIKTLFCLLLSFFLNLNLTAQEIDNIRLPEGFEIKVFAKNIIKIVKQNTSTEENYTNYLKKNIKEKQKKNTQNVIICLNYAQYEF